MSGFEFSATDNSANVFNPGDLASRAFSGGVNFGVDSKDLKWIVIAIAVAAAVVFVLPRLRKG